MTIGSIVERFGGKKVFSIREQFSCSQFPIVHTILLNIYLTNKFLFRILG